MSAGAATPEAMLRPLFQAQFEKRSADMVAFPFAAAPEPPAPTEADLQRWYDNHPDQYSTPEYRRIKAVVLSPRRWRKTSRSRTRSCMPPTNSTRRVHEAGAAFGAGDLGADEAKAKALADSWRGGADWSAMQKAAQDAGGSAIALDDATEREFPDPDLARAVFAAAPDTVTGRQKGALGWYVVRVTKATPGQRAELRRGEGRTARTTCWPPRRADLMYDRANKVDNVLGSGAGLDEMPSDLGLVGVAGTLDAQGNTADGTPAPIPGPAELRAALITAAFEAQKGDPPRLVEVQTPSTGGSAYYALGVEDVTPPPGKSRSTSVKEQVAADWRATRSATRRSGGRRNAEGGEGRQTLVRRRRGRRRDRASHAAGHPRRRAEGMPRAARAACCSA